MTREEEARKMQHCGRAACQRYIGTGGFQHRYLPWRYCLACARAINKANKDLPGRTVELPFDLSGVPEDAPDPTTVHDRIRTHGERNPDGCFEFDTFGRKTNQ